MQTTHSCFFLKVSTGFVYCAVPATSMPNVCAEYDRMTGALQTIESTWNEVVCKEKSYTLILIFCWSLELIMNSSLEHNHQYV